MMLEIKGLNPKSRTPPCFYLTGNKVIVFRWEMINLVLFLITSKEMGHYKTVRFLDNVV